MPSVGLVWLRNDLRLHDNPTLHKALRDHEAVVPVVVLPERWWQPTAYGFRKMGPHRFAFLLEGLEDLARALNARGGKLWVERGEAAEILPRLMAELGASKINTNKEVTHEEVQEEQAVVDQVGRDALHYSWTSSLYHVQDVPFSAEQTPEVFTQFRKQVEKYASIREEAPALDRIPYPPSAPEPPALPTWESLNLGPEPTPDRRAVWAFKGGEAAGLARLEHYFWEQQGLSTYKETRNGLLGADYSSKFSPWLAWGFLSPRRIFWQVKHYEQEVVSNKSTYWLVFELIWRDFFRFIALKHGRNLFLKQGLRRQPVTYANKPGWYSAWCTGTTGIPFVDANLRELVASGFMSNRGRQNVASFLVKDLNIDWRWGAAFFEHHLLDHDPSSNYGNWQYVAGVGNDPRQDRYFNIQLQAKRYDADGQYVRHWLPELVSLPDSAVQHPWTLPVAAQKAAKCQLPDDYPNPLVIPNAWKKHL